MALEWNPVCNSLDLVLGDSKVYPRCIKLLQLLRSEDRGTFGNAYGFMCIQFLSLALEIGKISQNDRFPAFQEQVAKLSPGQSIRLILNNYARELEGEGIWYDVGNVDNFVKYLGWDWGEDHFRSCLPQVGGCGFKDTIFLLGVLWEERASVLEVARVAAGIFPGWGGLLYVIWNSVLENLGWHNDPTLLVPRVIPKERADIWWGYILEVALRYAMCSDIREDPLVYVMVNNTHLRSSLINTNAYEGVDEEDAILVATLTARKLQLLSTLNEMNYMAAGILGYASMLLCPLDFEHHVKQLYKVAFSRAWDEISAVHRMDNYRWRTFAIYLDLLAGYLSNLSRKHSSRPAGARVLLDLALDWDLHELYAYMLLFPLSSLGRSINAAEKLQDDLEFETGLSILASGVHITDLGVHVDHTYESFPAWDKVMNHILFLNYVLGQGRKFNGRDLETL